KGIIKNIQISPGQDRLAYVLQAKGRRTVYIYDTKAAKTTAIAHYRLPPWIDDHSNDPYPLIQWHMDKRSLIVAMPIKGKVVVKYYNASGDEREKNTLFGIDGIKSIGQVSNREYLLSAYRKGQSDVVLYNIPRERYTPLTNDHYDDEQPQTGTDGTIYFLSCRLEKIEKADTLPVKQGIYRIKNKAIEPVQTDSIKWIKWNKLTTTNNGLLATHTRYGTERMNIVNGTNATTL